MSNIFDGGTHYLGMSDTVSVDEHIPAMTFSDGSVFSKDKDYSHFGFAVLSNNTTLTKGELFKEKMIEAKLVKAEKLDLRGRQFADFIEKDIQPQAEGNRNSTASRLATPLPDKKIVKPFSPNTGNDLLSIIKQMSDDNSESMSKMIESYDNLTSLLQNQNKIMKDNNEINLERNRLLEVSNMRDNATQKIMIEGITSIAQSLEYLPTLIEAMVIGNEKKEELMNTQNSHLYQKNVNDGYAFNYDKDDEKGTKRALNNISSHLASNASATHEIKEHQKIQAKHAENKIKDFESENSDDFISFLGDVVSDIVEQVSDVDIFTYMLKETSIKGGVKI